METTWLTGTKRADYRVGKSSLGLFVGGLDDNNNNLTDLIVVIGTNNSSLGLTEAQFF